MSEYIPRCGDHVFHRPSEEKWLVAWAKDQYLAPAGWPACVVRLATCDVVYKCSDEEHKSAVRQWLFATGGNREKVLRLYGEAIEHA